ncbi:hypothetical protein [Pseudoalteromonas spongiae]|uniref:hypothetical protein n=1 Tax=Pseudoalteromonas spongiae TaxID=298657 RepID=UPI000C2D520B|nr:hypothetical protein [Pseudoalteromonas spongiae]
MGNEIVKLDHKAVQEEIERQITLVKSTRHSMTHDKNLLNAIDNVSDDQVKGELLGNYLDALKQHQSEKNTALKNEVESQIKINEKLTQHQIDKDKARTELFNDRKIVLFLWVFPVLCGFFSIAILDSYAFAVFIMILLYGVVITLYFSQSDGLAKTWKALLQGYLKK